VCTEKRGQKSAISNKGSVFSVRPVVKCLNVCNPAFGLPGISSRLVLILWFLAVTLPAAAEERGSFFIAPSAETALYSVKSAAFGGGLVLGYGAMRADPGGAVFDGGAVGIKTAAFIDPGKITTLELNLFVRLYIPLPVPSGLFVQVSAGPCFYAEEGAVSTSLKRYGGVFSASAGIGAGWTFLLGKHWYVEPMLRAGYPYIAGAGVSGGVRF
jgi:hypothetical protein